MKRIKKSISLVLALLMLVSVCTVVPITVSAKSKKPYLNAKSVTLGVGENTVLELKNTNSNVTFESSNDKIVYVNSDGEIGSAGYGKIGTVTITAKSGGNTYKCKVKIQKKATKHAPKTYGDYQYSLL